MRTILRSPRAIHLYAATILMGKNLIKLVRNILGLLRVDFFFTFESLYFSHKSFQFHFFLSRAIEFELFEEQPLKCQTSIVRARWEIDVWCNAVIYKCEPRIWCYGRNVKSQAKKKSERTFDHNLCRSKVNAWVDDFSHGSIFRTFWFNEC